MEKKNLIITVTGEVNSGKSHLTFLLLKKFLRENGFEVDFDGGLDYDNESQFDEYVSENLDQVKEMREQINIVKNIGQIINENKKENMKRYNDYNSDKSERDLTKDELNKIDWTKYKIIEMKNLTDKEIEDFFDDAYKDIIFDDAWDVCVTLNAYKKGFKKAIEMVIENS